MHMVLAHNKASNPEHVNRGGGAGVKQNPEPNIKLNAWLMRENNGWHTDHWIVQVVVLQPWKPYYSTVFSMGKSDWVLRSYIWSKVWGRNWVKTKTGLGRTGYDTAAASRAETKAQSRDEMCHESWVGTKTHRLRDGESLGLHLGKERGLRFECGTCMRSRPNTGMWSVTGGKAEISAESCDQNRSQGMIWGWTGSWEDGV